MTNATVPFAAIFQDATFIVCHQRHWHRELQERFLLHPVVRSIIYKHNERPADWQQLLLEWPHVSIDDETQIAYTRNEQDAERDRQIRTSIGKYLARHWPHVPDHVRRDWAGTYGNDAYALWDTMEEIIAGVELGPQSCMKSSYGTIPFESADNEVLLAWFSAGKPADNEVQWYLHPYSVYTPELGWRMAVRFLTSEPRVVMGRCLVNEKDKTFVRSYRRDENGGYSHTDERLETWLREEGYTKASGWGGLEIAYRNHPEGDLLVPYIDGSYQCVYNSAPDRLRICDDSYSDRTLYRCNNTNGTADEVDPVVYRCEDCDEPVHENDDQYTVGRHDDYQVCSCCIDNYRWGTGSSYYRTGSRQYYIHEDNAIEIDGEYFDEDNPPSSIVLCADEEWRMKDDCVECADGEWYHIDDCVECADGKWRHTDDCVQCADGEWRMKDDCWESAEGKWYSNDESQVEVDGGTYHPDELRNLADNA